MGLDQLDAGVYAWLQLPGGRGRANAGAVVDADGVTVVDALMTPDQYEPFAATVESLGLPVRRLVRIRVGPIRLGRLPPGEVRELEPDEVRALMRT